MNTCDLCGKLKKSLKTYSVQTGYLAKEGLNYHKSGWKEYTYTNIYTDIKWHRFEICAFCRWKWNILIQAGLGLGFSILSFIFFVIMGDPTPLIFISYPFWVLPFLLIISLKKRLMTKARRERGGNKLPYAALKFEKS